MTLFSLFDDFSEANAAVLALQAHEFPKEAIDAIVLSSTAKNALDDLDWNRVEYQHSQEAGEARQSGLDNLFAGRQPVPVPDTGPLFAAGDRATVLVRTASQPGSADGGLKSALEEFGVSGPTAEKLRAGVQDGGVLLMVRSQDQQSAKAAKLLRGKASLLAEF